jgi:hypothetical protein
MASVQPVPRFDAALALVGERFVFHGQEVAAVILARFVDGNLAAREGHQQRGISDGPGAETSLRSDPPLHAGVNVDRGLAVRIEIQDQPNPTTLEIAFCLPGPDQLFALLVGVFVVGVSDEGEENEEDQFFHPTMPSTRGAK